MKKKVIAAIMISAVIGLSGCGVSGNTSGSVESAEETTGPSESTTSKDNKTEQSKEESDNPEEISSGEKAMSQDSDYRTLAKKVQSIIGERDMEKLKTAVVYPCYVGVGDGVIVDSEEEFMDLNPDEVLTDELIEAVQGADADSIKLAEVGLVLSNKTGKPNIIIGLGEDNQIGIVGINY